MGRTWGKHSREERDVFYVTDSAGAAVTGLTTASFTILVSSGTRGANSAQSGVPVTVNEIDSVNLPGWYEIYFTAPSNKDRFDVLVSHATHNPFGWAFSWDLYSNDPDDMQTTATWGGSGLRQITFHVRDQNLANVVGVTVDVYDSANAVRLYRATSDGSGNATFQLDDGSYKVRFAKTGVTPGAGFNPYSLTVTGDATIQVDVTVDALPAPSLPGTTAWYGDFVDIEGVAQSGIEVKVRTAAKALIVSSAGVLANEASFFSDVNGRVTFDVVDKGQGETAFVEIIVEEWGLRSKSYPVTGRGAADTTYDFINDTWS